MKTHSINLKFSFSLKVILLCVLINPDLTSRQFQYWASLNPSLISLLIQNHDHVTFYSWQSKSKSGLTLGKSNPSLGKSKMGPETSKIAEKNVKNSRIKTSKIAGETSKVAKKNVKNSQKSLKWPIWTSLWSFSSVWYQSAVFRTPGKWLNINQEIVARYEIFRNTKFSLEKIWKIGFDLGTNFQVLSKSWLRLARFVRLVFRLAEYWETN